MKNWWRFEICKYQYAPTSKSNRCYGTSKYIRPIESPHQLLRNLGKVCLTKKHKPETIPL